MENGHLVEVFTLMEGEWSCYRGGQFKGGRKVMLHFNGREHGHVTEEVRIMEGKCLLRRWPV